MVHGPLEFTLSTFSSKQIRLLLVLFYLPGFLFFCFTDLHYGLEISVFIFQMDNNDGHVSLQKSVPRRSLPHNYRLNTSTLFLLIQI